MSDLPDQDLDWLFARQRFGVHPGLDRIAALLDVLGQPQTRFATVLVGGTNGKGSTAATLASMLRADGRRVGLFTSPHLTRFAERFVVDGQELAAQTVAEALGRVRPLAEATGATFFEIVTALGCVLFAEAGVEWAVMEVGLGGRLDSTNVLEPQLSIVTNVALDHMAVLGDTTAAIAQEKSGILRAGRPAVTGVSPDLLPTFQAVGADLWALGEQFTFRRQSLGWEGAEVIVDLTATALASAGSRTLTFRTPLLGEHGAQNAALAAVAATRLGVGPAATVQGAAQVVWPGRMEVLPFAGGRLLLDGAHNPAGAQALATALRELTPGPLPLVFGAAEDKDIAAVARHLAPLASRVILTRAVLSPRAAPPASLAAAFAGVPVTVTDTPQQALDAVRGEPLSVVCGSLYLLGELRPLVLDEPAEGRERWQ